MESRSPVEANTVATALKLFNESGVEYVGMRELATSLGLRIGNLNRVIGNRVIGGRGGDTFRARFFALGPVAV